MDKVDVMRAFVAVVTEGSFTRAAERLDISPQLISKYVSKLEERLNVRLLNRTTRKVHLTEAGTLFFERARQLLESFDDMENSLGDFQASATGRLRISAPVSFATLHLSRLIFEFQQLYPKVSVDVELNDRKVDLLQEGFDIALRIGQLKDSSLIAKYLAPIRLVMCASPDYLNKYGTPKVPDDLQQHRLLGYSYAEQPIEQWQEKQCSLVSNNGDLLVQYALQGAGIALQPTFISGSAIARGKLQIVLPEFEPAPLGLYAVYPHRKLLASKVRCFLEFIDGYFGECPYWDEFEAN